jgi:hypothetical protein
VSEPTDVLRMYLVVRRGAVLGLAEAGPLAGAAAVACVRRFAPDPDHAEAFATWFQRPRKVCLRARPGEWRRLLEQPHARAGDAVLALPPQVRPERGALLDRMQAMTSSLAPPPAELAPGDGAPALAYALNPRAPMSSGKALAQIGHAAVAAAALPQLGWWVEVGCPASVVLPSPATFDDLAHGPLAARVVDAGLTEVAPGTVTVLLLRR